MKPTVLTLQVHTSKVWEWVVSTRGKRNMRLLFCLSESIAFSFLCPSFVEVFCSLSCENEVYLEDHYICHLSKGSYFSTFASKDKSCFQLCSFLCYCAGQINGEKKKKKRSFTNSLWEESFLKSLQLHY